MSIITLTTDFGHNSPYVAAMKAVILSINRDARLVDLTHGIPPQDVRQGAVVLDDVAELFPDETIHVAVVDPGVGTDRAIVYARIGGHHYVAPDNGLLWFLAQRHPPERIVRLENPEYWREPVSATFHGRDIMAPVAAHLSLGLDPRKLGAEIDALLKLDWPEVRQSPRRIDGMVVAVDSFGNLVTNILGKMLEGRPTDERVCVVCGIYETWGVYRTYGDLAPGTFIALVGSTGRLELAIVGDSAARRLGIQPGTPVVVAWE
jgi:S-adenosyl-L-methionine hydrolase (adenosine-forming)